MKIDNQQYKCHFCPEMTKLDRIFTPNPYLRTRICSKCHVYYKLLDQGKKIIVEKIAGMNVYGNDINVDPITKLQTMTFYLSVKDPYDYMLTLDYKNEYSILWSSRQKIKKFDMVIQGLTPSNAPDKIKMYLTFL